MSHGLNRAHNQPHAINQKGHCNQNVKRSHTVS
jgi:hypothetical protein